METIKEEKKSDLEQLLNSLIEKGWKPFGFEAKEYKISIFNIRSITLHLYHTKHPTQEWIGYSIRNITSKESGLWQFVCENKLLKNDYRSRAWLETGVGGDYIEIRTGDDYGGKFGGSYEYRLIESSLKDESELEDFLLNSISLHE